MHCDHARDWLLRMEQPGAIDNAPADVASHLRQCGACQRLSRRLERLEQAYHNTPLPVGVDQARAAFLAALVEQPTISLRKTRTALPPRRSALRWAIAASVLFVVATAVLMFWPGSQVQASADLVDRLVDWNLELAQAPSGSERDRIFADYRDRLTGELGKVRLADTDRQLAESLVANASWLSTNDNPMEAAERFDSVAAQLLAQLHLAADRNDRKAANRLARAYDRVTELGVAASLERAKASGALDFEHRGRLEKLLLRDEDRMTALLALLEVAPDASRKEIKRALGLAKPKPNKPAKPGKKPLPEK